MGFDCCVSQSKPQHYTSSLSGVYRHLLRHLLANALTAHKNFISNFLSHV